ncbi:hypothetical protein PP194_gp42 [Streptococcus phage CHPC1005]|uniref:DUF7204 domain-containing protein n=1 Tax=Streptococcus phage CHPC1005 TaxID=2365005 RepID=A0A3G8FBL2_9CAUD|nr:hypothetical protein PP194_gp42 [Streptococcus phage CHPC1005]AZF91222.1 hypothetical protein CHPC1005_0042 [Streptococcus phage CHPC1005]
MQYKVITYFDNMEDEVEIYDSKDEAIKRLHHLRGVKYRNLRLYKVEIEEVKESRDIINKPAVPQYVADWYEDIKEDFENKLFGYIRNFHIYKSRGESKDFNFWFDNTKNAIKTLINMHQFGYEVEKEKRYAVRIRNLDNEATYLNYDNFRETWVFYSRDNTDRFRTNHTREELESNGFGWVFDCEGIEVEEVE